MMSQLFVSLAGFLGSVAAVGVALVLLRRQGLLAEPNERSSHVVATPTGGGIGMVLVILVYMGFMIAQGLTAMTYWLAAVVLLAGIGFVDDYRELSRRWRFALQWVAALLVLIGLGSGLSAGTGLSPTFSPTFSPSLSPTFSPALSPSLSDAQTDFGLLSLVYLPFVDSSTSPWPGILHWGWLVLVLAGCVWFINLFNFMDGIDGYAAIQCLGFCLGAQLVVGGVPGWLGDFLWLLAGVSVGFLVFNWPPAKIFMGDVGSLSLGLLLGGIVLALHQQHTLLIPSCLILLSGFWFDATYTLIVRLATGQKITDAHRSHLYQRLAQRYGHLRTSTGLLLFILVWLLPLAWYSWSMRESTWISWMIVVLAVIPMAVMSQRFAAGHVIEYKQDVA